MNIDLASGDGYSYYANGNAAVLGTNWDDQKVRLYVSNVENLKGTQQADRLLGDAGRNILDGQSGNDLLQGNAGSDTYIFGRGAGQDYVYDYDSTTGNLDTIQFNGDVASDQLWFSRSGDDLMVQILGTADSVCIGNWYSGTTYQIETFQASDGKVLSSNKVDVLVQAMASFSPPAVGQITLSNNDRQALSPVMLASWQ